MTLHAFTVTGGYHSHRPMSALCLLRQTDTSLFTTRCIPQRGAEGVSKEALRAMGVTARRAGA